MTSRKHFAFAVAPVLLAGLLGVPAAAAAPACAAPVPSTTQPGYLVADPDCDLDGTPFTARAGRHRPHRHRATAPPTGSRCREHWNGELVLYAHGYRGTGTTVYVDSPVAAGALHRRRLRLGRVQLPDQRLRRRPGRPRLVRADRPVPRRSPAQRARSVYMTGASMGGHITAVDDRGAPAHVRRRHAVLRRARRRRALRLLPRRQRHRRRAGRRARSSFPLAPDAGLPGPVAGAGRRGSCRRWA